MEQMYNEQNVNYVQLDIILQKMAVVVFYVQKTHIQMKQEWVIVLNVKQDMKEHKIEEYAKYVNQDIILHQKGQVVWSVKKDHFQIPKADCSQALRIAFRCPQPATLRLLYPHEAYV